MGANYLVSVEHKAFLYKLDLGIVKYRFTVGRMIKSFQHKGLKTLYLTGSTKGVRVDHVARLRRILSMLSLASVPSDMDLPGLHLHPLRGELSAFWSVRVCGNWRVIFRFIGADVELVDYCDYH